MPSSSSKRGMIPALPTKKGSPMAEDDRRSSGQPPQPWRRGVRAAAVAAVLALAVGWATAATRYAGTCGTPNSATIAAAITASSAGDTILVCSGTWNEAVTVSKDSLTIRSATGNRADVTVSNSGIPFSLTGADITLKDMTIVSSNNKGINRGWTATPSTYTFENLAITAKDDGVYVDVSGKVSFKNVTVTSSNDDGINLGWNTNGEHVFDNVTISAKNYGIYSSYGGVTFKDIVATSSNNDAININPSFNATFTNVTATATSGDGIYLGWVSSGKTIGMTNVTVSAKDRGIYIDVSGKVTMTNVTATSTNDSAIYLGGSTSGAHVFDTVTATGKKYALYTYNGGATFKDITAIATDEDAIYLTPTNNATFSNITATSTKGDGIYMGWVSSGKTLSLTGLNVRAKGRGLYIEKSAAVTLTNAAVTSTNEDAVYFGYGASGAHAISNLSVDAVNSGIRFESSVSSTTISNVCVNSGQYGVRVTQYGSHNVAISSSKFTTSSYGVSTEANPTYKTITTGSCFMKSSTPRAYASSTTHTFNGNYWNGVSGGTSYADGNVRDTGTLSSCPVTSCYAAPPPAPVADYRMDDCNQYTGATGEVADSAGSYVGTPKGGLQNATPGQIQRYADFSSPGRHVDVATGPSLGSAWTITTWFKTSFASSGTHSSRYYVLGSVAGGGDITYLDRQSSGGSYRWGVYTTNASDSAGSGGSSDGSYRFGALASGWHHLALVGSGNTTKLYIDGVYQDQVARQIKGTFRYLGASHDDAGNASSGQSFGTPLDEFKIFGSALQTTQIANIYSNELAGKNYDGTTRPSACVSGPDHIRVFRDNNATALTCAPRSLSAIACADATCTSRYGSSVDVTLNPNGTTATIPANGTGTPAVAQTTAGTGSVTLSSSTPSATGATSFRCYSGTVAAPGTEITGSCNLDFSNAGFFVSVPDHVSCATATLTLTAAKTDSQSNKCVPAFDSGASRNIKLRFAYANPATGSLVPTVDANNPPTTALATGSDQTVAMAFTDGVATTNFRYQDAGSLAVSASYTGSAATGDSGLSMSTVSNPAFVVAPASFTLSGIPAAPLVAGTPFNVTATAKNNCGATTANFGQESTAATATVVSSNPQPGAGNATAISTVLSGFATGAASGNVTWREVGTIDLTATTSNYLGSSLSVTGSTTGVGRFRPAYFDTAVTHGCVAGAFTYSAQPFSVQVTARETGGATTANYAGATWAYTTTLSNAGSATNFSGNTIANTAFANGVGSAASVKYTLTSPAAASTLTLRATDGDGVSSSGHTEGTTSLRSGRLWLGNAYGSDRANLALPYEAQQWNGSAFVKNTADSCTSFAAANLGLGNYQGGLSAANMGIARFSVGAIAAGAGTIAITAPAAATAGSVDLFVNLGATGAPSDCGGIGGGTSAARPWLSGKWCGSNYDRNPTARATFGVFGSSARRGSIYLRESY